jgi:UDP-N-acetylmuramate--alanine ligase
VVVFQPRDRSLLRFLRPEYVRAFAEADHLVVGAAKDLPAVEGIRDVETLVGQLQDDSRRVVYLPSEKDISTYLLNVLRPGVRVIFFGDDEFLRRGDQILAELALEAERTRPEEAQPRLDGPLTQGGNNDED